MIIRSLSLVLFSAVVMFITTTISSSTKVNAHSFELCPGYTDHLHVSEVEMSPERPSASKPFSLKVKFKPDATYEKPLEVDVSVKVFGVKVYSYKFDACSDEAAEYVKCPLKGGVEQTLEAKTTLPSEVPRNIAANVQITIYHKDSPVTCISTLVHTDSRLQSESEQEQEFIDYFVNTFSYDEESVEFNEALRVGESNSVNYLLTQRQNNHKFVQGMRFLYQKWLEEFHQLAEIEEWYPVHDKSSKITFEKRFLVFVKNFIDIVIHNRKFREGKTSYAKKMNQFGHLHPHEFRAIFLSGYRSDLKKPSLFDELSKFFGKAPIKLIPSSPSAELDKVMNHIKSDQVPESIDWVEKGAVNPVKNQGSCGSCWAFSAISALESAYFLKYGELKSFSEQELVSCEGDCYGCRGGIMSNAFNWIHRHGGVCTDKDYAYTSGTTGVSGFCKASRCKADPKSAVKNYVVVDHTDKGLKEAVAKQPVSVAVEADQYAFQFYSHGVLTGECGDRDNHGVVVVGYGNLDGTDYWKVRNSWGASWGMQGYILIQRGDGVQEQNGKCGILVDPLYPVL